MQERSAEITVGATGLDEELEMIREQFRRYSVDRVIPEAHEWHLKDELIPMEIIEELAEMGVFGLTIPEEFGGFGLSKASMCVVSEELSRGYIGVGSPRHPVRDRGGADPCGGTEEQKQKWLPRSGQRRDPADGGLHRAQHRLRPRQPAHEGGEGRKRRLDPQRQQDVDHPCRAHPCDDVLARTVPDTTDYRGLSMFLAEKTPGTTKRLGRTPAFPAARSRCSAIAA
jgi:(2S)-methylsuccinyl-CoA dehydrogenase